MEYKEFAVGVKYYYSQILPYSSQKIKGFWEYLLGEKWLGRFAVSTFDQNDSHRLVFVG